MKPDETPQRIRRTADLCLIIIFFLMLWLPALDSLFHLDHAPTPNE